MAESRPAGQTKEQGGTVQAGTGNLERVQGCCPVVQGWGQVGQGANGAAFGKGCKH